MGAFLSLLLFIAADTPPAVDSRAALGAVIAYEARILAAGRGRAGCIRPLTTASTLGVLRNFNADGSFDHPLVIPMLDWRELSSRGLGRPISETKRDAIHAGVGSVLTSPAISHSPEAIARDELAPPWRLCAGRGVGSRSRPVLALQAPAFANGFAFVAVSANCGLLCGSGRLYALERRGASWVIVAVVHEWGN